MTTVAVLARILFFGFFPGIWGIIVFTYACLCHYAYRFTGASFGEFLSHAWSLELPVGVTLFRILWDNLDRYRISVVFLTASLGKFLGRALIVILYYNINILDQWALEIRRQKFISALLCDFHNKYMVYNTIWVFLCALNLWVQFALCRR